MTKTEIWDLQHKLFGNLELHEICMRLRSGVNGSADSWSIQDISKTVTFLKVVLKSWTPTVSPISIDFDNSIKSMIEAVLKEVKFYYGIS